MIFQYIVWDVKPQIIEWGGFEIRWYGLFFAISFLLGYFIVSKMFKKENISMELLDKLTFNMILGTVIGARLGHCLFYQPEFYLTHPWKILFIWEGGLASHGAAIGILTSLYLFSRNHQKPYFWIVDRIVVVVALAGFFIRMGNLMNSEIYGHATNLPWGFIFVRNNEIIPKHPTQIYEALSYLIIFILLLSIYYKNDGKPGKGVLFGLFLILVFSARFFIEFIKEVQVPFERNIPLNMGQWLSIPLVITGIIILVHSLYIQKNHH